MIRYTNQYDQIISNVTIASEFSLDFKSTLDHKMYRCVVGGNNAYEQFNPLEDVRSAWVVLEKLKETTRADNISRINDMDYFLSRLNSYILDFSQEDGYDYNYSLWEDKICVLTEIIREKVQEYIYYETKNLADLQTATSAEIRNTTYFIAAVSAVLITVLWLFAIVISGSISKPIKELSKKIQIVGEGDFTYHPVDTSSDEIQALSNSFKNMVNQIGVLMEHVKQEQDNLRSMELRLLQAQINPHFLYNTFDTIIWLAEDNQTREVVQMTTSLSQFFRTTLSGGRDFITLQEEGLHIQSYLEIQSTRYRDILEYTIDIPETLHHLILPKLTLQPVVENALYHGIKKKRGAGKIQVSAYEMDACLYLKVTDNGAGMTTEELTELTQSIKHPDNQKGFGLANVQERIRLYFGEPYGLTIQSKKNSGTEVLVKLGIKKETS